MITRGPGTHEHLFIFPNGTYQDSSDNSPVIGDFLNSAPPDVVLASPSLLHHAKIHSVVVEGRKWHGGMPDGIMDGF